MKLSIITINFNNRVGLQHTINSVLEQSFHDFEYIVIDGGSTDGSVEVVKKHSHKIDYWVSESDRGIYNAMNKGIVQAKGDYCIFMNSGDAFCASNTLANVLPYLDGTCIVNGDTKYPSGKYDSSPHEVTLSFFMLSTIIHQSTFIRTDLLKNNNYDENYRIVSDWKFWLQELIVKGRSYKSVHIPISVFDEGGIGSTNIKLHDEEMVSVLRDLFPKKILDEYYFFLNGRTWENKLYIEIQHSRLNKVMYVLNSCVIKFLTFFKQSSKWSGKYPLFYSKDMNNDGMLTDVYGRNSVLNCIMDDK